MCEEKFLDQKFHKIQVAFNLELQRSGYNCIARNTHSVHFGKHQNRDDLHSLKG